MTIPMFTPVSDASFVGRGASPSLIRRNVDRRGLTQFAAWVAACALVAGGLLFHAWVRTQVTAQGYQLGKLKADHKQLVREREKLTLQLGQLASPGRVEELAKTKLGMVKPAPDRVVVLVGAQVAPDANVGPRVAQAGLASAQRK